MIRLTALVLLLLGSSAHGQATPLPFQLETASYWEPAEGSYAKIRLSITYDELLFVKAEEGYTAGYSTSYRVSTSKGERVHTGHLNGMVQVFSFAETNRRNLFANEELRLKLPPGSYVVSVTIEDVENRRSGTRHQTLEIAPPSRTGFRLSSLMLMGCMEARQMLSDTLPDPCDAFTLGAELYAFGDSSALTLPVRVVITDSRGKARIEQKDSIAVEGALTKVEVSVGISRLEAGTYDIRMEIGEADRVWADKRVIVPWSIRAMVSNYDDAHRLLTYVATKDEVQAFKKLPAEERTAFWLDYWAQRDPVPSTPRNELLETYEARIMFANDHFSAFEEGWKTDMGMVYVRFGPPDDIERHPFDRNNKPYEIWSYHALKRQFVFVDRTGFGRYDLVEGDLSRW
ncbi:MAG: GWxTD domain-containing protein [Candidatus Eisenbacteria bacterium]|jgi:GWxTD domain-containing protein|nr:GWxTD domain-containing protein [Candidatus Eisenbacteria bacterium]